MKKNKEIDSIKCSLENEKKHEYLKRILELVLSFCFFLVAVVLPNSWNFGKILLFLISYLIVGRNVLFQVFLKMKERVFLDENFLMMIATVGAIFIGEFPEAVAVMLFYQLGEFFQDYAVDQSERSISQLMSIRPISANVQIEKKFVCKRPEEVKVGDIILVKPGERVALDGIVQDGDSFLDMKALTGESVPVHVRVGDFVSNGCINQNRNLLIRVCNRYEESTVSRILNLVEKANQRKASTERFITKFSKIYTPVVVFMAVFVALIPPMFLKHTSFEIWIYRALSFLVVSCPCALVLSIPLCFFSGIGLAARHGILIKGSNYLEMLSQVGMIVFDKTGTLTEGVFEVDSIYEVEGKKGELLELVAHMEYYSDHPIAVSVQNAYQKRVQEERIRDVEQLSGLGIVGKFDGKKVVIGNGRLLRRKRIKFSEVDCGGTILYVAVNQKYRGYIVIKDRIRKSALDGILKLKKIGIQDFVILTGDQFKNASEVASSLGIKQCYAELMPDEKVLKLEELAKDYDKKVLFVGDGMNDAPVLALADVGVSMGGLGSDAAMEACDIVLMHDQIEGIFQAIQISKKTLQIAKQNIIFAISVKVLILVLSLFGLSTMWGAVFADVGVSVLSVLNSLRIFRMKL